MQISPINNSMNFNGYVDKSVYDRIVNTGRLNIKNIVSEANAKRTKVSIDELNAIKNNVNQTLTLLNNFMSKLHHRTKLISQTDNWGDKVLKLVNPVSKKELNFSNAYQNLYDAPNIGGIVSDNIIVRNNKPRIISKDYLKFAEDLSKSDAKAIDKWFLDNEIQKIEQEANLSSFWFEKFGIKQKIKKIARYNSQIGRYPEGRTEALTDLVNSIYKGKELKSVESNSFKSETDKIIEENNRIASKYWRF